jgi:hypothetical protein
MARLMAEVEIEGEKPLLIHTFPVDTLLPTKQRAGTTGNDDSEWKKTCLFRSDGQLYVLGTYLFRAIVDGGKQIKVGKGTLSKKAGSSLEILEPELDIKDRFLPKDEDITTSPNDPVYIDVRSVVNPMTKGRNLRYRVAVSKGWRIEATLLWDDRALSKDDLKVCLENAGLFEGIGDGRRIGFGRFSVIRFNSKKS